MPVTARTSLSCAISVTVRLVDGPAAGAAPVAARLPPAAIDDTAISSVFQASQAGHWPCHCAVWAPQLPQT